jgi:integrase
MGPRSESYFMPKTKRRIRSPHPGVYLLRRTLPSGSVVWQARYEEPDSGKIRKPILDAVAFPTHEARTLHAKRLSKSLARRRGDLAGGAPRAESKAIDEAIKDFVDAAANRLRGRTLKTYGLAFDKLLTWSARRGVKTTGDLTRAQLAAFREHLIARPRKASKAGGRRGESKDAAKKRSPVSINRELRTTKTMLGAWRVAGILPHLDRDAITDALKALPVTHEQPEHLTPAQLDKLLHAATRHDAAVFAATREEHAGLRPLGSTRRYEPIAGFTAFLLLTGCRRGEALGLKWSDVDLDALDHEGRKVGEIRLRGEHTKTHRARTIGLEVSPALRAMLAGMKLRAGRHADTLHVFGAAQPYSVDMVEASRQRMMREYGAPTFDWQGLRSTCATFLTNAHGIFGAASAYMSAKQLGHSVTVAERHYTGLIRGIPKGAHTLEAAMQIEPTMRAMLATVSAPLSSHLTIGQVRGT